MARGKFKGKPTGERTFSSEEELASGTSAGRPKSFKKKQVEKEVYERREESIEEEDEEEVEKIEKHKGTAGLIEIDNPNLAKPKSIKAKDVDVDRTAGLSRREREELEKQRSILHYKKLQEEGKTDQARKDLDHLAQIRQERAEDEEEVEKIKHVCNTWALVACDYVEQMVKYQARNSQEKLKRELLAMHKIIEETAKKREEEKAAKEERKAEARK